MRSVLIQSDVGIFICVRKIILQEIQESNESSKPKHTALSQLKWIAHSKSENFYFLLPLKEIEYNQS